MSSTKKVNEKEKNSKKEKVNFFKKWYIYQKERFPVLVYGIYILAIILAAFKFGYACQGYNIRSNIRSYGIVMGYDENSKFYMREEYSDHYFNFDYKALIPMFVSMFLLFLMVRIVDEFKDYKEDCKYRPYRPVPRGLVSRWELAILFVICLIAQIGIFINQYNNFNLEGITLVSGIATAVMFILLGFDFFIGKYLSKHKIISLFFDELLMFTAVIYILSFIPNFYSYANSGSGIPESGPSGFIVFMLKFPIFALLPYIGAWIMEIARKMRCEDCEEKGVKTYTAVFGIPKASIILSIVEIIFMAVSCFEVWFLTKLNNAISLPVIFYLIFIVLGVICLIFNFMFNEIQSHKWSKNVEYMGYSQVILTYIVFFFIFM